MYGELVSEGEEHVLNPLKDQVTELNKCGSCYGAEEQPGDCCNTCEEVCEDLYLIGCF